MTVMGLYSLVSGSLGKEKTAVRPVVVVCEVLVVVRVDLGGAASSTDWLGHVFYEVVH